MDPAQTLKLQIGELIWNQAALAAELERVNKELDELKNKSPGEISE